THRETSRGNWIAESPRRFYAIAGATYVYFPSWSSIQMELIDGTFPHTNFRLSNMHHDIGLFRLQKPFYINSHVKYVTLPLAYDANIFQRYTDPCTVVGWGRHIPGSNVRVGTYLRRVHIPLIPTEKCPVKGVHTRWHLCAGVPEGGLDSCQGDSGGPLLCDDIQVGIVSWGEKICALPQSPGVYCRLDLYLDWVNKTVENNNASINTFNIASMFLLLMYIAL
ncbi:Plasma kallikrein, partial [Habropoda laboriosa]